MRRLTAYLDGIAIIGPGIRDWPTAEAILAGRTSYAARGAELPIPMLLPAAERRRAGRVIKLAIALGLEAASRAGLEPASLVAVFSSSGGDGDNCHSICQTLASADRNLSPTRFHHSVQNVPAGYWSIATGAMAPSTTLCAYDASFAAGLLEALAQVALHAQPVLLIAYDASYPSPLHETRPILDMFGTGWVLAASPGPRSVAHISATLEDGEIDHLLEPQLEALRTGTPAGRSLPILARLANREKGPVNIEYLGSTTLCVEVTPC
jgi:Beta-ketoacyl synthase, N-terminal domain